jgi:hypothetical protein
MLRPFSEAARLRFQRFVRHIPATTPEDHFWLHHWQNAAPGIEADSQPPPANHLSLDL